ncbi:MAG: DUF6873 family GME fold protein [Paludibacteraceae bacterium]
MESFLISPNLPINPVSKVMTGECYIGKLYYPLNKLNINLIPLPSNSDIAEPVKFHADMNIHHISGNKFVASGGIYEKIIDYPAIYGINLIKGERQSEKYPADIGLNACRIGKYLFHNFKYTDKTIISELGNNVELIDVKQGYTKCSVCIIDEFSAITSDKEISKRLRGAGIDTLEIVAGHINLPGCDYGFLGGAAVKLSRDILAFTGNLNSHPDKIRIIEFLKNKNIQPVFLTDEPCFDIGSIIPITQYSNC